MAMTVLSEVSRSLLLEPTTLPSQSLLLLFLLCCAAPVTSYDRVDPPTDGTDVLQNCSHSYVILSDADNYTLLENDTLIFQGTYYNVSFYNDTGNSSRPVICIRPPSDTQTSPSLLSYVLLAVLCLAMIASIALLITYSLFKKLRTLPGKVIMNLAVAFLAGDTSYLLFSVLVSKTWFLFVVGYFFYVRFMWMALTGFEICRNVYSGLQLTSVTSGQKNKLLVAYILIGWGVPIFLPIVAAVVHYTSSDPEIRRVFGMEGYVTYLVPIGLTVLFNAGAVIFLSIMLHKAAVRQKQLETTLAKRRSTNYKRVFLVILTALGFTWISVVVTVAVSHSPNEILLGFIVVTNASQPIFVSIAFIGTKKVIKEYLTLCGCRKKKKKEFTLSREKSLNHVV